MASDPRFSRLRSDPRFRRPRKDKVKVLVDERFKGIFDEDEEQRKKGKVDKYGRAVPKTKKKDDMRRFYKLYSENEEEDGFGASTSKAPDYARGQVLMESSDEDEFRLGPLNVSESDEPDSEEDIPDEVKLSPGSPHSKPSAPRRATDEESEDEIPQVNLDESEFSDLDAQAAAYSKSDAAKEEAQRNSVTTGEETSRLAIVNLDWDHVRAHHLFKIFHSIVSAENASSSRHSASVVRIGVYPSEFGKERIAREEKEGPPPELFKRKDEESPEDVGAETIYEIGDADKGDYDDEALRRYQLERLRYHYAIAEFDSPSTAHLIYTELDGAELGWSANVFDLSYVPENMEFDGEPRDECTEDPGVRKPLDFSTDALRHSKVKLTWDDDDPERVVITRRKLTKQQVDEEDFGAYIASSSSGEDSEPGSDADSEKNPEKPHDSNLEESALSSKPKPEPKKGKYSASALRALLLDPSNAEELPEGWGGSERSKEGEISVTFAPGLSTNASVGDNDEDQETTLERYIRRQREKKAEKKAKREERLVAKDGGASAKAEGAGSKTVEGDDFFGDDKDGEALKIEEGSSSKYVDDSAPPSLADDEPLVDDERKHFRMKDVLETEKKAKRRKFKKRGHQDERDLQIGENFAIDVKDERFKALHDESEFAIDPTNPQFKSTAAMKALLHERAERQKQRKRVPATETRASRKKYESLNQRDIQSLVESVKRKSVAGSNDALDGRAKAKRRKV